MSQPHPPIPEPQPHPQPDVSTGSTAASAEDLPTSPPPAPGPRTNSILVPPSQRPADPEAAAEPLPEPLPPAEPFRTAQFPAVRDEPAPDAHPGTGPAAVPPPAASLPHASQAPVADALPPVPGPSTAPVAAAEPHPHTSPVSAPADEQPTPSQPGAAHRAGAKLAGVRRAAGGRSVLAGLGLAVLALLLLQLGLALDDDLESLWAAVPTWSAFATLAVLVVPVPLVAGLAGRRLAPHTAWQVGAAGVAALAVFWVLVALPLVLSDRGFWLTAALGAAGAALWLAPGRDA